MVEAKDSKTGGGAFVCVCGGGGCVTQGRVGRAQVGSAVLGSKVGEGGGG